jgi:hypothetical protein
MVSDPLRRLEVERVVNMEWLVQVDGCRHHPEDHDKQINRFVSPDLQFARNL